MFLALDRNVVLKESNAKRILHVLSILNQTDHLIGITGYEAQGIVDFDKFHFLSSFFLGYFLFYLYIMHFPCHSEKDFFVHKYRRFLLLYYLHFCKCCILHCILQKVLHFAYGTVLATET
jgi:hypothetical protein